MKGTGGSVLRLAGASQGAEPEPTLGSRDPGVPVSRAGQAGAARSLSCAGSRIRTGGEQGGHVIMSVAQWSWPCQGRKVAPSGNVLER